MTTGNSKFRAPPSRAEPRASVSCDARGELHQSARHDCLITPKPGDIFGDHLANQPGLVVFVGLHRSVEPFQFIDFRPFHTGSK